MHVNAKTHLPQHTVSSSSYTTHTRVAFTSGRYRTDNAQRAHSCSVMHITHKQTTRHRDFPFLISPLRSQTDTKGLRSTRACGSRTASRWDKTLSRCHSEMGKTECLFAYGQIATARTICDRSQNVERIHIMLAQRFV